MQLRIYNTKSRQIEKFVPQNEKLVTMYSCGPTVYDFTHIGHMRKYVSDDILKRTLNYLGYPTRHVMNITDVGHLTDDADAGDDKLEKKALLSGKSVWDIASFFIDYFHQTMKAINVSAPDIECRATDNITQMIELVKILMTKGFAYETKEAVYFDIKKFPTYGSLSGQKIDQKELAVRDDVVIDPDKRNPADFALWFKRVGKFAQHSMHWPSPWGDGFPGWHIECSAMSMFYLGATLDIHTGGIDHIPVHHENEIAQSQAATGKTFVNYWVHYDFLLVNGVKMSKSLNNFFKLDDIIARQIDPLATRLLFLQTHYRKPLNFTWQSLDSANLQLKKLQKFASHQGILGTANETFIVKFKEALIDDLNTAKALAVLWELFGDTNIADQDKWTTIISFDEVLGLDLKNVLKFEISTEAEKLVRDRDLARENKDFATSDKLRIDLEVLGYEVLDTPQGTKLQ